MKLVCTASNLTVWKHNTTGNPPSSSEFPGPLTPPPLWNFQFPPWWGYGYFLEPHNTVEPRFTDTRLIRTPRYYGQFRWSRRKPHTFSLKLTRLIRTPVNTDNGHFSVSRVTNCHTLSTPLYGHCLSVHCQFSLSRLFANFTLVK